MHLTSDKKIFVPDEDDWYRWGADYEQGEYDNAEKNYLLLPLILMKRQYHMLVLNQLVFLINII